MKTSNPKKPISVDEFTKLKFLSNITYAPDGSSACFVVSEANLKKNDYTSHIWMLKNGKPKKLTSFGKERGFQYLDEDTILFPGKRESDGAEQGKGKPDISSKLYRLSLSGGEAELAYTFPIPVQQVLPLPGGDLIVTASVFPGFEDLYKGDKKLMAAYQAHVTENADYEIIEQVPWWWNGGTYTKGAYSGLFRYDAKKKRLVMLSKKNQNIYDVQLSKDKKTVYFCYDPVRPFLDLRKDVFFCRMSIAGGKVTLLASNNDKLSIKGYQLAEDFILLMASDNKHGINTDVDFYKIDYKTGKMNLYVKYGEAIGSSVGSDVRYGGGRAVKVEGNTLYFVSTLFDDAKLLKLEDGKITPVLDKPGSVDAFDVHEGKVLAICLYDTMPQELYDGSGKKISKFNDAALRGKYVAIPEPIITKRRGYDVHGFVLKPINYNPRKKYPVILDVHGGPKTVYGNVFYHEMQYWASKGYFVIFCNPTGSDGRNAFMDIRGKYGTVDYNDIMAFTDNCLKQYPAMDNNRLYETGGSYGGFMTNWIVGHTNRFRACASQRSISNWISFYGISDIGVHFGTDQCGADPWSDYEKVWEHSPLKYANKVKTPTLFIHSFEDYRCPIDQGYQMFTALVAHGVESKMVCFRGENHELSRSGKPAHRLKRLNEITWWFEKH